MNLIGVASGVLLVALLVGVVALAVRSGRRPPRPARSRGDGDGTPWVGDGGGDGGGHGGHHHGSGWGGHDGGGWGGDGGGGDGGGGGGGGD